MSKIKTFLIDSQAGYILSIFLASMFLQIKVLLKKKKRSVQAYWTRQQVSPRGENIHIYIFVPLRLTYFSDYTSHLFGNSTDKNQGSEYQVHLCHFDSNLWILTEIMLLWTMFGYTVSVHSWYKRNLKTSRKPHRYSLKNHCEKATWDNFTWQITTFVFGSTMIWPADQWDKYTASYLSH